MSRDVLVGCTTEPRTSPGCAWSGGDSSCSQLSGNTGGFLAARLDCWSMQEGSRLFFYEQDWGRFTAFSVKEAVGSGEAWGQQPTWSCRKLSYNTNCLSRWSGTKNVYIQWFQNTETKHLIEDEMKDLGSCLCQCIQPDFSFIGAQFTFFICDCTEIIFLENIFKCV